jgi:hypothetical protein
MVVQRFMLGAWFKGSVLTHACTWFVPCAISVYMSHWPLAYSCRVLVPHVRCLLAAPWLQVCAEFAELHRQLTDVAGVNVKLFQHHLSHGTPDAVFPNNWFSTHAAGEGLRARRQHLHVVFLQALSDKLTSAGS